MNDLERLVRQYYGGQALSEDRVASLLAAVPRADRGWYWRLAASLAAVAIGFGALHSYLQQRDVTELVLAEVAMNHSKRLEVEIASRDYAALQSKMNRLDFSLVPPEPVRAAHDLIGARYCSIRGNIAVQLKLRERSSGATVTLYVTELTPDLAKIAGRDAVRDGVRIRLWHEGGLFYALAGPDGSSSGVAGPQ